MKYQPDQLAWLAHAARIEIAYKVLGDMRGPKRDAAASIMINEVRKMIEVDLEAALRQTRIIVPPTTIQNEMKKE